MTIDQWLIDAKADAERRGLPELVPILETLSRATTHLRAARWLQAADGPTPGLPEPRPRREGE